MVAAKLLQVNGGSALICEANATVKRVMEVSGFSSLLRLYDTEKEGSPPSPSVVFESWMRYSHSQQQSSASMKNFAAQLG